MRKDLDRPHTTRGRPGWGTRGEAGSLGPPGARLTFLEGAGVKGVEEVGVGWWGAAASRKEAGAGREVDRSKCSR